MVGCNKSKCITRVGKSNVRQCKSYKKVLVQNFVSNHINIYL